jgi:formylglycine-generating enzyme required for sulfatase activity
MEVQDSEYEAEAEIAFANSDPPSRRDGRISWYPPPDDAPPRVSRPSDAPRTSRASEAPRASRTSRASSPAPTTSHPKARSLTFWRVMGIGGATVLLAGGSAAAIELVNIVSTPPTTASTLASLDQAPAPKPAPVTPPPPSCPQGMVKIPGGHFFMGSDDDQPNEKPAHAVTLSAFCIDATEVTAERYKKCSDEGLCKRAPRGNEWAGIDARDRKALDPLCTRDDRGQLPMNCVDWSLANAYCAARGERLPTEAEWEFAARGPDGRKFPWGDDAPNAKRLNACGKECVAWGRAHGVKLEAMYDGDDAFSTLAPVGSFPQGDSRFGVHDVAGNVWEWTADLYGDYKSDAQTDPKGATSGAERAIRGGAWNVANAASTRATFRGHSAPEMRSAAIGFRCAKGL